MLIRKFKNTDTDEIIGLLRFNTPSYFAPSEEQDLLYHLQNHASDFYVLEVDTRLLACGGINLHIDNETASLSWDMVHPQFHGMGLGTSLAKFRIRKIKEIKEVKTISVRTSQLVYKFYEHFGLEVKEIVKDYWEEGFDLYRMDCDLKKVSVH